MSREELVVRLQHQFSSYLHTNHSHTDEDPSLAYQILQNRGAEAVKVADTVLLACQSCQAADILGDPSISAQLSGKLLLSICIGMSSSQIQGLIYGDANPHTEKIAAEDARCYVVQAMPKIASTFGASATVLSTASSADRNIQVHCM